MLDLSRPTLECLLPQVGVDNRPHVEESGDVRFAPQERTFGQSPRSAREPLAGKAVLCDRRPFRGSDRLASDVKPLVQHIVHATLVYIVAGRDRVLIFASPMSEPDINSVIERKSVCHAGSLKLEQTRSRDHDPCHEGGEAREQQQIMQDDDHRKSPLRSAEQSLRAASSLRRRDRRTAASRSGY